MTVNCGKNETGSGPFVHELCWELKY